MFRLLRFFSVASFFAIAVMIVGMVVVFRHTEITQLIRLTEGHNILLARSLSNALWPQFGAYVDSVEHWDGNALRAAPETAQLHDALDAWARDLPVLKIKIYNLNGLTVFSSDAPQMGEGRIDNPGFIAARNGAPVSRLSHPDSFSAFSGELFARDIVESYVPVTTPSGEVVSVFELYTDVTSQIKLIELAIRNLILGLVAAVSVLYGVLFLIVRRADRILARQYREIRDKNEELSDLRNTALDANLAKSRVLANMSHELRTPLNAIIGFSSTMTSQTFGPMSAKYLEYAADINISGMHLLELITDILDISAIEAGKLTLHEETFDLKDAVDDSFRVVRQKVEENGLSLELALADDLPRLRADPRRFKQILLNLLSNAIKFTPPGGVVTLDARPLKDGALAVAVSDTGHGMDENGLAKAMTEFGQADAEHARTREGTGLGLPLTKRLVELHDGTFHIESALGQGTTVTVTFPAERVIG